MTMNPYPEPGKYRMEEGYDQEELREGQEYILEASKSIFYQLPRL